MSCQKCGSKRMDDLKTRLDAGEFENLKANLRDRKEKKKKKKEKK